MIGVVDYGVGNIQAFLNVFKRLGIRAGRVANPPEFDGITRLILPGVGHFDHAMQRLNDSGLRPYLEERVLSEKVPLLGICVGMQMLAKGSDEGKIPGLGWVPARVRSFSSHPLSEQLPMPHMGWNILRPNRQINLISTGFDEHPQFYFLHSFYFDAENKSDVVATASYGFDFDAIVAHDHIYGVQCHPEKSHHWGEQLLKNFAEF